MSRRPSRDDNRDDRGDAADARFRGDRDYDDNWSPDEYFSPQDIRGTRAAPSRGGQGGDFDAGLGGGPQGAGHGGREDYGQRGTEQRGFEQRGFEQGREDHDTRSYDTGGYDTGAYDTGSFGTGSAGPSCSSLRATPITKSKAPPRSLRTRT